jgi:hypothetical protein
MTWTISSGNHAYQGGRSMPKLLTFIPKTKKAINKEIDFFTSIKQVQMLHCNTIRPVDVDYTLEKLKEKKGEL